MSMFIGVIQVLSEPLVLSFADSRALGIAETVCALGMLTTALVTGIAGIRKRHAAVLGISLALAGLFMTVFALQENIVLICISGILFFAMLPLANSSLDYLARSNIPDELQGRAWGFIGFLSQLGYVPAFAFAGLLILISILSLFSRRIWNLESGAEREASGGPCRDSVLLPGSFHDNSPCADSLPIRLDAQLISTHNL